MSASSLLRVSDFCRTPKAKTDKITVRLIILGKERPLERDETDPTACVWVSDRFLRRASLIAGKVVWIIRGDNRRVAVRTILLKDTAYESASVDDDFDDTLEISTITAANLGLLSYSEPPALLLLNNDNTKHQYYEAHVEVFTGEIIPIAKKVTVRYWGRSVQNNSKLIIVGGKKDDDEVDEGLIPSWPKAGVLLQQFALTATHRMVSGGSSSIFFLEVVEVCGEEDYTSSTGGVYQSSSSTAYRLETLPATSVCPALPCRTLTRQLFEKSQDDGPSPFCHPNVPQLVQSLHNAAANDERLFHVIGTENEHHLVKAIETTADILGRRTVTVRGLAAYAYQSGCQVTSGSFNDKLTGLHAAIQQAHYSAPALLLITDLDKEVSQHDEQLRHDEERRIWSLLTEELLLLSKPGRNNNNNCRCPLETALPVTPSVLVVLSSRQALRPGPILQHLTWESIPLSVPDQAYAEYLWTETCRRQLPLVDGFASLVKGRTAGEIVALVQDYAEAFARGSSSGSSNSNHDDGHPKAILENLCTQQDKNRRKKSGVAKIPSVQWQDVGGLDHVRLEIMEAIEYPLNYPHLFANGAGRGVCLYGPPGTGKTLVAKAVATECSVPFLSVKGPELLGSYVGESEAQVRAVFDQARQLAIQNQPSASILFFDELDSLAPRRGDKASGGNVMDRVVATLFAELDKHQDGCTVFCIGATNRPDLLDPALLRPGRLDRLVYLGVPQSDQSKILAAQIRRLRLDGDANAMATAVADQLPSNLTGADISTICTGGLLRATQRLCQEADEELQCLQANGEERATLDQVLSSWTEERLEPVVTLDDLLEAAKQVVPSVSQAELDKYEGLREQFKSC